MGGAPFDKRRFFAPDGYWRTPIADKTPFQHPTIPEANSANWVRSLCWQQGFDMATGLPGVKDVNPLTGAVLPPRADGKDSRLTSRAWMAAANPVYVVPAGYPRREFRGVQRMLDTVGGVPLDALLREGVPAPLDAGVTTDGNTDLWLNVYQPSTDTLWELFGVSRSDPDGPIDRAIWGGVIFGVSRHSGTYTDQADVTGRIVGHQRWSGNACSISNIAGMISHEDLIAAAAADTDLGHAIPMSLGFAQGSPLTYVWPARRGDGAVANRPDYIPEGACITFPDDADDSRVPPEFRPVFKSAQKYGIYPRDKTGFGCVIQLRHYSIADAAHDGIEPLADALPLYAVNAQGNRVEPLAANIYQLSLPWHQAIIVRSPSA